MTPTQVQDFADRICSILISHAAHGIATSSLEGMGEITLRDAMIVAAAAAGAEVKQAWVLRRENLPPGWADSAVDLIVFRAGNQGAEHPVGGVELKWWRQDSLSNASNRRKDLVKDFIRAAALYPTVDEFSFVALLSTDVSWSSTTGTAGADKPAMDRITAIGSSSWNLNQLSDAPAVKNSVRFLAGKLPIPNIFHSKLVSHVELKFASGKSAFAKIWAISKPQNTHVLSAVEIQSLLASRLNPPVAPLIQI